MRPPKLKWQLVGMTARKLFDAIEAACSSSEGEKVRFLREARLAVEQLEQHINDAEECEQD